MAQLFDRNCEQVLLKISFPDCHDEGGYRIRHSFKQWEISSAIMSSVGTHANKRCTQLNQPRKNHLAQPNLDLHSPHPNSTKTWNHRREHEPPNSNWKFGNIPTHSLPNWIEQVADNTESGSMAIGNLNSLWGCVAQSRTNLCAHKTYECKFVAFNLS